MIDAENLNDYIAAALQIDDIIFLISVNNCTDSNWDKFTARAKLGIGETLSDKEKFGYIARIDLQENICEEILSDNCSAAEKSFVINDLDSSAALKITDPPNDNKCYLYSYPTDLIGRTQSRIIINGIDYSKNKKGLNIVLYSKKQACVIDSINVDICGNDELTVIR